MADTHARRPVALVTGGTRGIGLGIARSLAADGWDLAISGLRPSVDVSAVVDELSAAGASVLYCAADIADTTHRARLVAATLERFGGLNFLVNNAGRAPRERSDLLAATEESFEEVLRTNLQGPYFLTQQVARLPAAHPPARCAPRRSPHSRPPRDAPRRRRRCRACRR